MIRAGRMFALSLALSVAVILGASGSSEDLAGDWFTTGAEHGILEQMLYHRSIDGTFVVRARQFEGCRFKEWIESGTWAFSDGAIEQITNNVDNKPASFHDTYRVVAQTGAKIMILDVESQLQWTLLRVDSNFTIPPPAGCTGA